MSVLEVRREERYSRDGGHVASAGNALGGGRSLEGARVPSSD